MAITKPHFLTLTLAILLIVSTTTTTTVAGLGGNSGRFVGGRTEIKDVKTNKEVQDLGKFSVEEYNRQQQEHQHDDVQFIQSTSKKTTLLMFKEVVEAQRQVVSGTKYYLKISANQGESHMLYDSVVVVKPWVHSKELLGFTRSN